MTDKLKEIIDLSIISADVFDFIKDRYEKAGIGSDVAMEFLIPAMLASTWANMNENISPDEAHKWLVQVMRITSKAALVFSKGFPDIEIVKRKGE